MAKWRYFSPRKCYKHSIFIYVKILKNFWKMDLRIKVSSLQRHSKTRHRTSSRHFIGLDENSRNFQVKFNKLTKKNCTVNFEKSLWKGSFDLQIRCGKIHSREEKFSMFLYTMTIYKRWLTGGPCPPLPWSLALSPPLRRSLHCVENIHNTRIRYTRINYFLYHSC